MNKFLIEIQAKLDELKSIENINKDIAKIQKQIDTLKIQTDIDFKSISNLAEQLEKISNQKINISDIGIDKNTVAKAGKEANKEIEKALNIDDIINKAVKRMAELTGRSGNKTFANRLEQIRGTLNEDKDIAKLFDASIEKTFNTSSLNNIVNIIRTYKKELMSFDDVSKQFASTITSQFSTVIPASKKIDESIFEICKTFAHFKNETQQSYQTTGKNFFIWIQENTTESEKKIFHATKGFEEFQAALRGISFNNSNLFDYSTTLGLDTLNYNSDAIESLLRKESDLVSESNIAEQKLSELRQALIDAFQINAKPDGSLLVTLDQLQEIVLKCPQAQEYIDEINSSLVQISKSEVSAESAASSFADEIVKGEEKKQQAIQETIKLQSKLASFNEKIKDTGIPTVNNNGVVDIEKSREAVKEFYAGLGKVTTKNEMSDFAKGAEQLRVSIESSNGELKRTESFLMKLSDDGKSFVFVDDIIRSSESTVRYLNEQKEAANKVILEEEKLANAMADVREKSEQARQAEEKRQELAQSKAINKGLEEEYKERQKNIQVIEKQLELNKKNALAFTESASKKLSSAISKYSYGDSSNATAMMKQMNRGLSNFGDLSNVQENITQFSSTVDKIISDLKASHEQSLKALDDETKAEQTLQSQKDSFNQKNLNAIDYEIQKREQEAKAFSSMLQAQMQEEQKLADQVHEIQLSMEGKNVKSKNYDLQIDTEIKKLKDLGFTDEEVTQKVNILTDAQAELRRVMDSSDFDSVISKNQAIIDADKERTVALNQVRTAYAKLKNDNSQFYNVKKQTKLSDDIQLWLNKNGRASQDAKEKLNEYFKELNGGRVSVSRLEYIQEEYNSIKLSQTAIGKIGKSLSEQFKSIGSSVAQLFSIAKAFDLISSSTREAISELKEVDTLLTEISKANDTLSKSDLKNIGNGAFEVASKYGKKATDYLLGVQEASRAGYENASSIAELSVAAQGAGDMTAELANQYIIATDKAYKLGGSVEKLTEILDGSNKINKNSLAI